MKKMICLVAALCLFLSGCAGTTPKDTVQFYYCRTEAAYLGDDGIIAAEDRELSALQKDLEGLLASYFSGPLTQGLELPFPKTTTIEMWEMTGDTLTLSLSDDFSQLSGIDLTIACACITKTFLPLAPAGSIRILSGETVDVTMSAETLKLSDDSLDKLRTELTLYYTDESRRYLLGFNIAVNLASQTDIVGYLIDELLTAPTGLGLESALPDGTRLLDSAIEDGICTLHLSPEFETNAFPESFSQRTTLLSIVNTLSQLESVDRVEIYIDGNLMAQYRQLNIIRALVFDESAIGPVRTGVNEFDATLYLDNGSEQYLAVVPVRIRQTAGSSQAELVVRQLLDYSNPNSFSSPVAPGTKVHSVTVSDGLCTVDLSLDFLESENLNLAVRSVVASVCALEDIDRARITIDGQIPGGEQAALFEVLEPMEDWYI